MKIKISLIKRRLLVKRQHPKKVARCLALVSCFFLLAEDPAWPIMISGRNGGGACPKTCVIFQKKSLSSFRIPPPIFFFKVPEGKIFGKKIFLKIEKKISCKFQTPGGRVRSHWFGPKFDFNTL